MLDHLATAAASLWLVGLGGTWWAVAFFWKNRRNGPPEDDGILFAWGLAFIGGPVLLIGSSFVLWVFTISNLAR